MSTFIALVGPVREGCHALAIALVKELGRAVLLGPGDDQLIMGDIDYIIADDFTVVVNATPARLPDIVISIENDELSHDEYEISRSKVFDLTRKYQIVMIHVPLLSIHDVPLQALFLKENIIARQACQDIALQAQIDKYDWYFADGAVSDNFTWAMEHPLSLAMFFEKTKKKYIPLSMASITSMIARCIENNLDVDLLKQILSFCDDLAITGHLYLRRISNVSHLLLAAEYGFIDPEFTKRIINAQRLTRNQPVVTSEFAGRRRDESSEYYGYRHAMYFARYARQERLNLFKYAQYGGCNWQGYRDALGDEIPREACDAMLLRK